VRWLCLCPILHVRVELTVHEGGMFPSCCQVSTALPDHLQHPVVSRGGWKCTVVTLPAPVRVGLCLAVVRHMFLCPLLCDRSCCVMFLHRGRGCCVTFCVGSCGGSHRLLGGASSVTSGTAHVWRLGPQLCPASGSEQAPPVRLGT